MCGSACLPGGGAAFPALPLAVPNQVDTELWCPYPGRPREVTGRGGTSARNPMKLQDRPGRRELGSRNPPSQCRVRTRLPPAPRRSDTRALPARRWEIPREGAVPRSAPPSPLSCGWDLETESRTKAFTPAFGGKGSSVDTPPPSHSNETRTLDPQNPACTPCGQPQTLRSPKLSPTFLLGVHGRFPKATDPRSPPCVPSGPGPLIVRLAGLRARSQAALAWASAPLGASPPPSSCRLTQPAGMGRYPSKD
jgi:hypothetical protein